MTKKTCPSCGQRYERLAQHWAMSSVCDYPLLSDHTEQILMGILMGDGTVHSPPSANNARLEVTNINRHFLNWMDEELGWLSNGVRLKRTAEEIREENLRSNHDRFATADYAIRDQYVLTTARHPFVNELDNWYGDNQKRYPPDLKLNPTTLKLWYVCDGTLLWGNSGHKRPQARIEVTNEADRPSYLKDLFADVGFHPQLTVGE